MEKSQVRMVIIGSIAVVLIIVALALNLQHDKVGSVPLERFENIVEERDTDTFIYVDVKGAVLNPGVYKVKSETRLFEVIALAGGLRHNAYVEHLNLAKVLHDQALVSVPFYSYDTEQPVYDESNSSMVSLSRATKEQLTTLPNIGPATADNIIAFREENGPFETIEGILEVRGIGEATFETIKPFIIP